MTSVTPGDPAAPWDPAGPGDSAAPGDPAADADAARRGRRLARTVRESLRDLSVQISLLNQHVGGHLDLRATDLECLDLIVRFGPLGPSALARRAGLHPATMTGILDRLERGGWIARDRDPVDRRGVTVRVLPGRVAEVIRLYSGMSAAVEDICAGYTDGELEFLASFLRRTAEAGRAAADKL
jgi:DNA-binding MarR family transcriptional regulator